MFFVLARGKNRTHSHLSPARTKAISIPFICFYLFRCHNQIGEKNRENKSFSFSRFTELNLFIVFYFAFFGVLFLELIYEIKSLLGPRKRWDVRFPGPPTTQPGLRPGPALRR